MRHRASKELNALIKSGWLRAVLGGLCLGFRARSCFGLHKPLAMGQCVLISYHSKVRILSSEPHLAKMKQQASGGYLLAIRCRSFLPSLAFGRTVLYICSKRRIAGPPSWLQLLRLNLAIPVYRKCEENHWYIPMPSDFVHNAFFCKSKKALIILQSGRAKIWHRSPGR